MVELFILLFANDAALLTAATPVGLQNQLNSLRLCCGILTLSVNKEKTDNIVQEGRVFIKTKQMVV